MKIVYAAKTERVYHRSDHADDGNGEPRCIAARRRQNTKWIQADGEVSCLNCKRIIAADEAAAPAAREGEGEAGG